jgi:hypothetical protein
MPPYNFLIYIIFIEDMLLYSKGVMPFPKDNLPAGCPAYYPEQPAGRIVEMNESYPVLFLISLRGTVSVDFVP